MVAACQQRCTHGIMMRCKITCLPGSVSTPYDCSISLTWSTSWTCIVTRWMAWTWTWAFFFCCKRVFWLRFFLAGEFDCCRVIEGGKSDYEACGACGVGETFWAACRGFWAVACLTCKASRVTHSWRIWFARSWRILACCKNQLDCDRSPYQSGVLANLTHSWILTLYSHG